jgi:hypothetical protein
VRRTSKRRCRLPRRAADSCGRLPSAQRPFAICATMFRQLRKQD